jgi:hypothetical protein
MDTDDLSEEAYKAIIVKSDLFHHDLTLQFGMLSSSCENENEYLEKSLLMIANWETDIEFAIDEIYFDNAPEVNQFKIMLVELKEAIKSVQKISIEERTFEG